MKSYGLDLQHSDVNSRASEVLPGTSFPTDPMVGSIFYLTTAVGHFAVGQYLYDGASWTPYGDITSVQTGYGLTGGGAAGDVTISLDANVVTQIVQQVLLQDPIDPIAMSLIFGS